MATTNHSTDATTTTTTRLPATERAREACRTVLGRLDVKYATHCRPEGDWRPVTQTTTEEVWTHPVTGATVRLESSGITRGWTVELENGDARESLIETPTTRRRAFEQARARMADHLAHYEWDEE